MRLTAAATVVLLLAACSTEGASPSTTPEVAPSTATVAQMTPYYGSYVTQAGDRIVIARMGWFFDLGSSDYRTIYVSSLPARFSIGCAFQRPLPRCADLSFTSDTLTMRDISRKVTVAHRVRQTESNVSIPAAGATLAGAITEPEGSGLHGGVVIVHGSEPGQRFMYDIWVGVYTSLGLDVLTYDKRGIGASSGHYPGEFPTESSLQTYADDASAALTFLKRRPNIDPARVGFHGGSQGGWTVPLAVYRHGGAGFAVLVSAPATTVDQTDLWSSYSGGGQVMPAQSTDQMLSAVRATHSGYDPTAALRGLSTPSLWLLGTNDRSVPTAVCLEILLAMRKANFTIQMLPTGHGLLVNSTGLLADDQRSRGLAPEIVPAITSFLQASSS